MSQPPRTDLHEPLPPRGPDEVAILDDQIRSLKTLVAVLGLVAAAALGVALYTLLSDREDGDGRGASQQRVSNVDDRVDRLEERVKDTSRDANSAESNLDEKADAEDLEALQADVEQLKGADDGTEEITSSLEAIDERVERLAGQVAELRQSDGGGGGGGGQP